jgi:hypothetical protein
MRLLKRAISKFREQDRLLRYEASPERALDLTLIQLEQLQRMRRSQKTIEVPDQTTTSE